MKLVNTLRSEFVGKFTSTLSRLSMLLEAGWTGGPPGEKVAELFAGPSSDSVLPPYMVWYSGSTGPFRAKLAGGHDEDEAD